MEEPSRRVLKPSIVVGSRARVGGQQDTMDGVEQRGLVERLAQVGLSRRLDAFAQRRIVVRGNEDDGKMHARVRQVGLEVQASHPLEVNVEHQFFFRQRTAYEVAT